MKEQTLSDLIALGEGFTSEFKRSMPSSLGREICVFANATGGVILVGVDDSGEIIGVKDGSGIQRIRDACLEYGVAEPMLGASQDWPAIAFPRPAEAAAPHVPPHVAHLIAALRGEMSRTALMGVLNIKDRRHFYAVYLQPSLDAGLVEMTIPDKPRSRMQRYQLTAEGAQARKQHAMPRDNDENGR